MLSQIFYIPGLFHSTVKEKSINIELLFIEEVTVKMLAKLLIKKFNQESVVIAEQEIDSDLYKG